MKLDAAILEGDRCGGHICLDAHIARVYPNLHPVGAVTAVDRVIAVAATYFSKNGECCIAKVECIGIVVTVNIFAITIPFLNTVASGIELIQLHVSTGDVNNCFVTSTTVDYIELGIIDTYLDNVRAITAVNNINALTAVNNVITSATGNCIVTITTK